MFRHHFTPQEANQRLPLVRSIVQEIIDKGRIFRAYLAEYEEHALPIEADKIRMNVQELLSELEDLGCFFKDWNFEQGIVDFPSEIDGKEVLLSWRADEEEVLYYHDLDNGYAARKPIPKRLLETSAV